MFGQIRKPADEAVDLVVRSEAMPVAAKQELVEVPVVMESAPTVSGSVFRPVAIVCVGGMELSLTNGVTPKLTKQLKELLSYAE